jgi:hypothetical protein
MSRRVTHADDNFSDYLSAFLLDSPELSNRMSEFAVKLGSTLDPSNRDMIDASSGQKIGGSYELDGVANAVRPTSAITRLP